MTAEVIIMNTNGMAIAADSAVTVFGGAKEYPSVDKIFRLSKHVPVCVVINDNADLLGIPWETIVKVYSEHLGDSRKETLAEYASDFIKFVQRNRHLFPEKSQARDFLVYAHNYYEKIARQIDLDFQEMYEAGREQGEIDPQFDVRGIITDRIREHQKRWKDETSPRKYFAKATVDKLFEEYVGIIDYAIEQTVESQWESFMTPAQFTRLRKLGINLVARKQEGASLEYDFFGDDEPLTKSTGLVIAGFGEKDYFPSLRSYVVEGLFNNRLLYQELEPREIGIDNRFELVPLAQREMVHVFVSGIAPQLEELVLAKAAELIEDEEALQGLEDGIQKYKSRFRAPIDSALIVLPKSEMAAMAESLVTWRLFQRQTDSCG